MSHPAVQSTVVKVQRKVPYWVHTEIACAQPLAHGGRWKGLPSWLFGKYSRTLCAILEEQMCTMYFKVFFCILYWHFMFVTTNKPKQKYQYHNRQQLCSLGIKRSASKKNHNSINVRSILSDDKIMYKVNRCLARYSPRATTTNRPKTGHWISLHGLAQIDQNC